MIKHILATTLAATLMATSALAQPAPKVDEALKQWVGAIESGSVDKVIALYADNAYMLPTFGTTPLNTQTERAYYYKVVLANPDKKIDIVESHPHEYGKVATNSGLYNYHYSEDGEPVTVQARFTFVYELRGSKWVIVEHHASQSPGSE